MRNDALSRVGVVGGGLMGSGIAEVAGRAGLDVVCVEISAAAARAARARTTASVEKAGTRGHLGPAEVQAVCARISFVDSLDALADRQIVIEAATEHEATKLDLFGRLARVVDDDAILASNTSSIPIVQLGAASGRPAQVIGIHFFNPAPVMPLVELIPSLATSEQDFGKLSRIRRIRARKDVHRCPRPSGFCGEPSAGALSDVGGAPAGSRPCQR
jgi:3-hydroxybutyryl-CoA dehydrogenase